MTFSTAMIVGRLRVGRAIRNIYDGVMAGESWAIWLIGILVVVGLLAAGYFVFEAIQEAGDDSDDLELTSEEKNLMNRF